LGWNVCLCSGEADVCIGLLAAERPGQVVAVSGDSDLLFRGLEELIRKQPASHTFTSHRLADILETLKLHPEQWKVAGIVSNNDYTNQAPGQTFEKNVECLSGCSLGGEQAILQWYRDSVSSASPLDYTHSVCMFIERVEIRDPTSLCNSDIDAAFKEIVEGISAFMKGFREAKRNTARGIPCRTKI
ncbi:hypothetical protein BGW38_007734, partial [Lunasporangiospora selenospora]